MEISKKAFVAILVSFVLATAFMGGVTIYVIQENNRVVAQYNVLVEDYNELVKFLKSGGNLGEVGLTPVVHSRVRMWKDGKLIFDEYNAGAVTNLGDNMTLFWLFGDTDMQYVDIPYMDNCTFISIGNDDASLGVTSTVLPGEWNRTAGTIEDEDQSCLNVTCTFYPDASGPYTADCIGLNTNATASANNLIMYDTFTEVSGIDDTFTINVEFKVSVAHS